MLLLSLFLPTASAADYNCDGYDDLLIGAPDEGASPYGYVHVLYGSGTGLTASGDDWINQATASVEGTVESGENFGAAVGAGDFDNDGCDDLAVGAPDGASGGEVNVLRGSSYGVSTSYDQLWSQDTSGVEGGSEAEDNFGSTVETGDFDGDGYADLAIGNYTEALGSATSAGAVNVLYGTSGGLSATDDQVWYRGYNGMNGSAAFGAALGIALAAGDFNGDGRDDLAMGGDGDAGAGSVAVLYGSTTGLSGSGDQNWHQDISGISGTAEASDWFGRSLAACDFDDDGYADLAVGAYRETEVTSEDGVVHVLYGTSGGLSASGNQLWSREDAGMPNGDGYWFGFSLGCGDLNGDDYADLAIGSLDTVDDGWGTVTILYGSSGGITTAGAYLFDWTLAPTSTFLGSSLGLGDYDGDGYDDVSVGYSTEDPYAPSGDWGGVLTLYGSALGVTSSGAEDWNLETSGVQGSTSSGSSAEFGFAIH